MNALHKQLEILWNDKLGMIGAIILLGFILMGVFAPYIAPYDPEATNLRPDGSYARMDPPSPQHLLGTTRLGRDVFSQLLIGSRVALLVGFICAIIIGVIGTVIGVLAGYFGGIIDNFLMRMTDIVYGIPLLPFAVIWVALVGPGLWTLIAVISFLTWRTTTRVIRSQVLTIKQRTFIEAARISGAGHLRIIFKHIVPQIVPITMVYTALTMGFAILTEASLSFLGYGDPFLQSWGKMLYMAYVAQAVYIAWWWVLPPGIAIILLVASAYFISRAYEEVANPRLRMRKR